MSTLTLVILVIHILILILVGIYFTTETFLPQVRHLMSYDLRGDIPIPYRPVSPWNNPEVGPVYNRPLVMGPHEEGL
jgi:hypothetical protein